MDIYSLVNHVTSEPLSQLAQTKLPSLIDSNKSEEVLSTFKSILSLSIFAAVGVGAAAFATAFFGAGMFSSNVGVQAVAKATAPMLFLAVSTTIVGTTVDGAVMASRDWSFMLMFGVASIFLQTKALAYCNTVGAIFATFAIRMGAFALLTIGRTSLGCGNLGKAMFGGDKHAKTNGGMTK